MPRTSVPEAAINKNGKTVFPKDEIWSPDYLLVSTPSRDAVDAEQFGQSNFGVLVPLSADT